MADFAFRPDKKIKQYETSIEATEVLPKGSNAQAIHVVESPSIERKVNFFSQRDIVLICGTFSLLVACLFLVIASKSMLTSTSKSLQDVKTEITQTQTEKVNTQQEVNELSSYDRIIKIAEEEGLTLNESNIRNVGK